MQCKFRNRDVRTVDCKSECQLDLYRLDGFVFVAGHDARNYRPPFTDVYGIRTMGYYDGNDLNYYYFMASNFATSDRWFHPVMSRTGANREYVIAATSQGRVYPNGMNADDSSLLTATMIFEVLQNAGITWKIYVNPDGSGCSGPPYDFTCLLKQTYVQPFVFGQSIPTMYPQTSRRCHNTLRTCKMTLCPRLRLLSLQLPPVWTSMPPATTRST